MQIIDKKLELILEACEDRKGIDIETIDISHTSSFADYFVIVSGNSTNQVKAIADAIDKAMTEYTSIDFVKEGYSTGRWILMDYHEVVVHVFHKEEREFYNLERLWKETQQNS